MLTGDFVLRHRIGALELLDGEPSLYHFGDGRLVLEKDSLPRLQYKLSDHLGNTVVLFEDRNGNGVVEEISGQPENSEVLQRQLYYPFGLALRGPMPQQPSPAQDYRYNGKERLPGSEIYAYGFRHYDPVVGRFLGVDPLAGEMAAWSPYAYTFDNPLRFVDPDGRSGVPIVQGNNLIIRSHFYVYGGQADNYAKQAINDITTRWNDGNFTKTVEGKEYNVSFEITYEVVSEGYAKHIASENKSPLNNFLRIESGEAGSKTSAASKHGGNSFYLATGQLGEGSTTSAHEYGHGLGMMYHDGSGEFIQGQPGIMTTIHTAVSAEFTLDPSKGDSKISSSENGMYIIDNQLNTSNRRVRQDDINRIYINMNKSTVGDMNNKLFTSSGKEY